MDNQPTFADCLRPVFTEHLVKRLVAGETINLIGPHGLGRRRTVSDLRRHLPDDMLVLYADMKNHRQSYAGLIETLWKQTSQAGNTPTDLAGVLTALEHDTGRVLFILHNFDVLRGNPDLDPLFNPRFFDALNSIRNQPTMGLLIVSEKEHGAYLQQNGKDIPGSTLDLQAITIPVLSHSQLLAELQRCALPLAESELNRVASFIIARKNPCDLLECFCHKLQQGDRQELRLDLRLQQWSAEMPKTTDNLHQASRTVRAFAHICKLDQLVPTVKSLLSLFRGGKE